MSQARLSACMLISHKGHTDTIQVYSVTVMTHVKALQAGHSSQGTSEPITPAHHTGDRFKGLNVCIDQQEATTTTSYNDTPNGSIMEPSVDIVGLYIISEDSM